MLTASLAPYLLWAKTRQPAEIDLAGSNLVACTLDDLPGAREALELSAPNDNGYGPLVEAIAAHAGVAAGRVVTSPGCSGANFIALAGLVGPGDEVLIERPGYDPLIGAAQLLGARVERFERRFEQGYAVDLEDLARRVTSRTRLIVVSTPHNPSGQLLSADALRAIGAIADEAGAEVLVDEVYLDAVNVCRDAADRAASAASLAGPFVVTSSLTKSYGLSGLRCGWIVAPEAIAERLRRVRDLVDNVASAPADRLSVLAFASLPRLQERTRALLRSNLERARAFLAEHRAIEVAGPPEAQVMFPRFSDGRHTEGFTTRLHAVHGVAVAPGQFFEAPTHFRVSLAGRPETLAAGLARLGLALGEAD